MSALDTAPERDRRSPTWQCGYRDGLAGGPARHGWSLRLNREKYARGYAAGIADAPRLTVRAPREDT